MGRRRKSWRMQTRLLLEIQAKMMAPFWPLELAQAAIKLWGCSLRAPLEIASPKFQVLAPPGRQSEAAVGFNGLLGRLSEEGLRRVTGGVTWCCLPSGLWACGPAGIERGCAMTIGGQLSASPPASLSFDSIASDRRVRSVSMHICQRYRLPKRSKIRCSVDGSSVADFPCQALQGSATARTHPLASLQHSSTRAHDCVPPRASHGSCTE